jgi:hypothetical protein
MGSPGPTSQSSGRRTPPQYQRPARDINDLLATELTIGSDTALNSVVADVDKIKQPQVDDDREPGRLRSPLWTTSTTPVRTRAGSRHQMPPRAPVTAMPS